MADEEALVGSMMDSVILVTVRSLFAGRKFFTPEIRFSKFAPRAPSFRRSVSCYKRSQNMLAMMSLEMNSRNRDGLTRLLIELKPRRSSPPADCCAGCVGAEAIIVIRVISRTLKEVN